MAIALDLGRVHETAWVNLLPKIRGLALVISDEQDFGVQGVRLIRRKPLAESFVRRVSPWAIHRWAQICRSESYHFHRSNAIRMLDREDPAGTFRNLDRVAYFEFYCLQVLTLLGEHKISTLVSDVVPHEFVSYVWWWLCRLSGIPTLSFQPCSIAPALLPIVNGERFQISESGKEVRGLDNELCKVYVENFFASTKGGQRTSWVQAQEESDQASRQLLRLPRKLKLLFGKGSNALASSSLDFSGLGQRASWLLGIARNLITFQTKRHLRSELRRHSSVSQDSPERFAVFALHYEPERTSLPEGGDFVDQLQAIIEARRILPPDVQLVVKEHYSQVSGKLRGHIGRSVRTYRTITMLPNTVLVGESKSLLELAKEAVCLFTLTGSIGLEATYLGRPVVYFGLPWWAGVPGSVAFTNDLTWGTISKLPRAPKKLVEGFLTDLISRNMLPGLAGETLASSLARWGFLPDDLLELQETALELTVGTVMGAQMGEKLNHPRN